MVFLGVQHDDRVFHNTVLEVIDLHHCELLLWLGRVLDAESWVVHHQLGLLGASG